MIEEHVCQGRLIIDASLHQGTTLVDCVFCERSFFSGRAPNRIFLMIFPVQR